MSPVISSSNHLPMLFLLSFQFMFWYHSLYTFLLKPEIQGTYKTSSPSLLPLMWLNGIILSPNTPFLWSPPYFYRHSLSSGLHIYYLNHHNPFLTDWSSFGMISVSPLNRRSRTITQVLGTVQGARDTSRSNLPLGTYTLVMGINENISKEQVRY